MLTPLADKHGQLLTHEQVLAKGSTRIKTLWLELVTGILWWVVGCVPLHSVRNFCYRLFGMSIGPKSTIHMFARIYDPAHIQIGAGSLIGERCTLDGRKQLTDSQGGLIIGEHVDIASEVMIWTSEHDIHDPQMAAIEQAVKIEDYVFIGPRAIILPGVTIGRGAVVGAGAVVTKSVSPGTIVGGVPAHKIGDRDITQLKYTLGRPRLFQ